MASIMQSMKQLSLTYNEAAFESSAREIVFEAFPAWKTDAGPIVIHRFTEGIMNTLLKLTKEVPGRSDAENDKKAILLRAYGRDSDIMINREMEITTHMRLAERGLASSLLARFQNGLLYEFLPGRVCTANDLLQESIWRSVAARLGEWHARVPLPTSNAATSSSIKHESISVSSHGTDPYPQFSRTIWTVLREWLDALPSKSEEQRRLQQVLKTEFDKCFQELNGSRTEDVNNYVLGHCDLLSANVIVPAQPSPKEVADDQDLSRKVHFIDFEYSVPCPPAYDLANHFSEWGGYDCDYNMLPTRSTRRRFIEQYFEYYTRHEAKLSNNRSLSVSQLCSDVDRYRGLPGLCWGVFSLIQQEVSEVKFDWQTFADKKLAEFWAWRREVDGSREQSGEEMGARELRWCSE